MLTRSKDAHFLNRVLNDPSVLPWVNLGMPGALDLTSALECDDNIFLANEFGGFLFMLKEDGYEVHTQFLPSGRGHRAIKAAKWAANYIFTKTDALRIDTHIKSDNLAAERLARLTGFRLWSCAAESGQPLNYYVLTLKEWARSLDLCQPLQ